jgi:competence ComEA-like helix-hairpin-helix protein
MLTPAAVAQSLCEHSLAYVKQSIPFARTRTVVITVAMVAQISLSSGCVRLPRQNVTEAQPTVSNTENAINLNTASTEELEKLPGIGKAIAERIVTQREQYGPFRRPEHLMMVRGISDQKFRAIRSMITVE